MTTARTLSGPGEEYYQQDYRSYDRQNPDYKLAYYRSQIDRYRDRSLPCSIHDVGRGPGNFQSGFDQQWTIFGSDINTFAVERAGARVAPGQFRLGAGALETLLDERFAVVTAFDVLSWEGIVRYLLPGVYVHLATTRLRGHTPAILAACRASR